MWKNSYSIVFWIFLQTTYFHPTKTFNKDLEKNSARYLKIRFRHSAHKYYICHWRKNARHLENPSRAAYIRTLDIALKPLGNPLFTLNRAYSVSLKNNPYTSSTIEIDQSHARAALSVYVYPPRNPNFPLFRVIRSCVTNILWNPRESGNPRRRRSSFITRLERR